MTAPVIANSAAPLGIVLIDPATGLPYSAAGGGVAFSAGTNSFSSGTIILSNSNGITFGMGTNGVITATVIPGAAAGIAAFQLPNTTYTSGTVNFINSNGLSFGSTTGGGVTASYTVPGATVFSNSNNVSFGLAGSTVTATATLPIGIGGAAAGSQTGTSGTLVFANSNGLTFGMSGSSQITGSYSVPGATVFSNSNNVSFGLAGSTITATATFTGGGAAISAAGSSQNAGTIVFSNSNGVSFGMNGSTITATVTPGAAAGIGAVIAGTQTQTSGTLSFANSNGLTFGLSGSSQITASYAQTNQSLGIYGSSQTTGQSSSSTIDARSLSIVGAGVISVGMSAGSLLISAPGTTGLTQLSAGISSGGNTTGTTGLASAQLVLAGGSNITLSGSTNAGSMTVSIVGGAGGGGGVGFGVSTGGNTAGSTGTVTTGNVVLVGSGPISLSQSTGAAGSAATITINGPATSSLVGTNGISLSVNGSTISVSQISPTIFGSSNTTAQSSSSSYGPQSLTIVGAGGVSVGWSSNGLIISGATGGGGGSVNFSAGATSNNLASVVFSNSNGVSFGLTGSTITASALGVSTGGLYALGNTTQNSSTTLALSALSFAALGAMTWGYSNGSIQVSAPVTSSISATGIVSVSVNGSTISIGASLGQLSFFQALPANNTSITQIGQGSVVVYPVLQPEAFTASRGDVLASISGSSSSNSSFAGVVSVYLGAYTRNGSTLSLASSGSQSYQFTNTSNNSFASITGLRRLSVPININYPGNIDLYVGMVSLTSSTNANWFTASNIVVPWANTAQLQGLIGEASNNSKQYIPGMGTFSATSAAIPVSIGISNISGLGSSGQYLPPINFVNFTA